MNDDKFSPDDPRLTAYALGELAGEELAATEAALRDDPAARATVAEIRATAAQLTAALASEATPPLRAETSRAHAAILPGRDPGKLDGGGWRPENIFQFPFPRSYAVAIGGLAAACLALVFALRETPRAEPKPVVREIATAPVAEKTKAVVAPTSAGLASSATGAVAGADAPGANGALQKRSGFNLPEALTLLDQAKDAETRAKSVDTPATNSTASAVTDAPSVSVAITPSATAVTGQPVAERDSTKGATQASSPDEKFAANAQSASPGQTSAPAPAAKRAEPAPRPGGVADNNDRLPISENRGLPGFVPSIDLDKVTPRYAQTPTAGSADRSRERDNDYASVAQHPVSSFAIDTDTAGYTDVRSFLQKRQRPPREVVHIEEMLNFFPFRYSPPKGEAPFAASMEVADAPWMPSHRLVRIGLKAREVQPAPRPPMILMFVIDVVDVERLSSRLPMIKAAIESLLGKLQPDDRVGLVSCRNQASLALGPTPATKSREIIEALESLVPGGATSRMKGIQLAYGVVQSTAVAGDSSRVILCTDGNAELTITAEGPFARFLNDKKKSGVAFTAFGFGMGIYHDSLVDFVADYGSGNYGYIDSRRDAEKMLAEDVNGPPETIAKDVTVEVAFNPAKVASYRLIGYDNRELKKEDFNGEAFDADEVGAGHAATALFEIVPVAAGGPAAVTAADAGTLAPDPSELLTMKVRYKKPGGAIKRKLDFPLFDSRARFVDASTDFKFAAAVAGLGMILRDSPHKGATTLTQVIEWAEAAAGDDPGGYRTEFVELAREAEKIDR